MARLLVAESDRDQGSLVAAILTLGGHEVRLVTSGREALDECAAALPDVILLDVDIPGMDGYQVARSLQECPETAGVPVVFITDSSEASQEAARMDLGANDYITRPFRKAELLARVAVALRLKRQADELRALNAQLAALSVTDPLTGLYNRRHLGERLAEEVARAVRYGTPLSCLMLDVDHFKAVNDRFGHQEGDRVLLAVARVLRASTRLPDLVARYGGEEFTILAPATSPSAARALGERIRGAVAALEVPVAQDLVRVTISVGVAGLSPGDRPDDLIAAADRALYAAKAAGRNRVECASREPPGG